MSRFLGLDHILCLSPHPDDVELGMSGTIWKFRDTKFTLLCCSIGTQTDNSSGVRRHQEISAFWERMSCGNVELCFIEDFINLKREDEWVHIIEEQFLKEHEAILTVSPLDSHFEHKIVSNVAVALVRHRALALIEYKSFSTLLDWVPNLFVDITESYSLKVYALEAIKSQLGKNYFQQEVLDAAHIEMQCVKRLISRVEQFRIINLYE